MSASSDALIRTTSSDGAAKPKKKNSKKRKTLRKKKGWATLKFNPKKESKHNWVQRLRGESKTVRCVSFMILACAVCVRVQCACAVCVCVQCACVCSVRACAVCVCSVQCACVCRGKSIVPCAPIQPSSMYTRSRHTRAHPLPKQQEQTTRPNGKSSKKNKLSQESLGLNFVNLVSGKVERRKLKEQSMYAGITLHSRLHLSLLVFYALHILHFVYNTHRARNRLRKIASMVKFEKTQETEKTA